MWHLVKLLRKRVKVKHVPTRQTQWFRPYCETLEDRCLLTGPVTLSGPTSGLVGAPVTWTAMDTSQGTTPVYQFSVGPVGGVSHVIRDFSTRNSFVWDPMQEGN